MNQENSESSARLAVRERHHPPVAYDLQGAENPEFKPALHAGSLACIVSRLPRGAKLPRMHGAYSSVSTAEVRERYSGCADGTGGVAEMVGWPDRHVLWPPVLPPRPSGSGPHV